MFFSTGGKIPIAAAEGMWKLIRKESEGFQRSVGAAPDDDESDDEAQPRTQTRASAFSLIPETLRNRPRVSPNALIMKKILIWPSTVSIFRILLRAELFWQFDEFDMSECRFVR